MTDFYEEPQELEVEFSVTKITFNKRSKKQIEELIINNFEYTFPVYCDKVGIKPPNFYAILNGARACTTESLNKLLSGIGYQVSIETKLILHPIETGETANDVDYAGPEQESLSNEPEEVDEYDSF